MIGALIPQTRELLQHVRKLSQLGGDDDAAARARARRARRSLKVTCTLLTVLQTRHNVPQALGGPSTLMQAMRSLKSSPIE
jgi:hypothetical protein